MQGSRTVDQALSVLLAVEDGPRSMSELASATGLNRTVVHRMVASLHDRGFLRREGDLYHPGAVFIRFGNAVESVLRSAARPSLHTLATTTAETVVLSVPDHLHTVAIDQVPGRAHPLRVEYELGSRRPIAVGASGRALLAFLGHSVQELALDAVGDRDEQRQRLDVVRAAGYAVSHDELRNGVHGIAAPVLVRGRAVASISIITPAQRADGLLDHLDALLRAAQATSAAIDRTV